MNGPTPVPVERSWASGGFKHQGHVLRWWSGKMANMGITEGNFTTSKNYTHEFVFMILLFELFDDQNRKINWKKVFWQKIYHGFESQIWFLFIGNAELTWFYFELWFEQPYAIAILLIYSLWCYRTKFTTQRKMKDWILLCANVSFIAKFQSKF